jgi:hypothetical protein
MSMRLPILAAAVVFAVAALAAAAVPAPAAVVSPTKVLSPQVAVNLDGATVVAWERLLRGDIAIEARAGDGPLELGRTRRLARRGHAPRVAVGADGTKAVMWFEEDARGVRTVRVAVARPGHGFGRGQLVYRRRATVTTVGVAVQPSGRVVAIWQRAIGRLAFAVARRNHAFGRGRNLGAIRAPADGTIPVDPRDGSVVLAYGTQVISSPPTNQQAAVRTLSLRGSSFSAPTVLSQGPGTTPFGETYPAMVSGPAGTGVAYTQVGDPYSLNLVRRNADGSWAPVERISQAYDGAFDFPVGLQATLPADGSAVAAWSIETSAENGRGTIASRTAASIALPSAAFGPKLALTAAGGRFTRPAIAAAGSEAFVATAQAHGPVLLATRAAGAGAFAPAVALTGDGDGDVLLAAAGGHVLAAYQQGDRVHLEVVR